ncbi:MAG TPA: IS66 family transposase [Vicinamibacterales bacterium]|nr:IS66 family transposase [Vicinamibacterales bacterium]
MSDQPLREALEALRDQPDRLIEIILQQAAAIDVLQQRVAELEARLRDVDDENKRLRARVETLEKTTARSAAPFRIKDTKRLQTPRRPGRHPGHRGVARRQPTRVDAEVEVPLTRCPHCAAPMTDVHPRVQYIEEIPPMRPHVTRLTTYAGYCARCRRRGHSTHPLQVSTAIGAAGVHLGPRALALAALLNKHHGLTMRKTCAVLAALCGLDLTPGGLAQALARVATRLAATYEALVQQIRAGPAVHGDETSWWVGGPGWWLWVFATPGTTVYRVAPGRGRNVVLDTLGAQYPGVVISDCLAVYDGLSSPQHKCYAHHLRAVAAVRAEHSSPYAEQWHQLLHAAMTLKQTGTAADRHGLPRRALETAADEYLAVPRRAPLEEALRQRLAKQRDHLFTFLDHANVPATNNLAERQLRPAVIARKLSCGNKTPDGARVWEILTSVAATCAQRGESFLDLVIPRVQLAGAR